MGATLRATLLAALLCAAPAAEASRAQLDGYGLPRLLKVDPSTLGIFPGSTGRMAAQGLLDYGGSTSSYYFSDPAYDAGTPFVLALAGRGMKVGYFLDGNTHNLVLAQGGFGVTFGFEDRHNESDRRDIDEYSFRSTKSSFSERTFRLAAGWQHRSSSGRVWEIALGGRLAQSEGATRDVYIAASSSSQRDSQSSWESPDGAMIEVAVRSVTDHPGLLIAGTFYYREAEYNGTFTSPLVSGEFQVTGIGRGAQLFVGYRSRVEAVDELIGGAYIRWYDETRPERTIYYSRLFEVERQEQYSGGVFLSAQRHLVQRLVGRAGIQGTALFRNTTDYDWDVVDDSVFLSERTDSRGEILDPVFHLGLSWSWKSLYMDARLTNRLSLSDPFTRWALTVPF